MAPQLTPGLGGRKTASCGLLFLFRFAPFIYSKKPCQKKGNSYNAKNDKEFHMIGAGFSGQDRPPASGLGSAFGPGGNR
jgi:hypothetical protein